MGCGGAKAESATPPPAQSGTSDDKGGSKSGKADKGTADKGGSGEENKAFLTKVPLFKTLALEDIPSLLKAATEVSFEAGTTIIEQGDQGNEFFVIKSGTAKVEVNGNMVANLKKGDYFGDTALLRDVPRTATIVAQNSLLALKITRTNFQMLELQDKLVFAKRGAVGGDADAEIKPPSHKSAEEIGRIKDALKANVNLNNMISLDDAKTKAMIDIMWKQIVSKNATIIVEGDLNADYFYVINKGKFDVTKISDASSLNTQVANSDGLDISGAEQKSTSLARLEPGKSFGELALLYFSPRAATITSVEEGEVFVMARQQFKEIITKSQINAAGEYVKYLEKCTLLNCLKNKEMTQLAEALTDFHFTQGEAIFEQGNTGALFYILVEGEVSVIVDKKEVTKLQGDGKEKIEIFGERALLTGDLRAATMKVLSPTCTCLAVDKTSFDILLGPLQDLQKRGKEGSNEVQKARPSAVVERRFNQIKRKDLKSLGLLGCGGFGAVELVEHVSTGEMYALKALSKGYVIKTGMQKSVMSEKDVQLMCDSPFIIKLYETYNGLQDLYLLLELALGGELYATYNKKSFWGNEAMAKFYVAGTLFAFDHLHERKIIYRDLKPENLLLNENGRVKLTDMGLAKVVVGKTFTTCGTPDYFAPELIASKGHGEAVDWWTLGILNYELLAGHPPFESASPMQIYQKVTKGINKVQFPKACKGTVESLIKGNCHANPAERLPMRKGGIENIKGHDWYKGTEAFDWKSMENLSMKPPYEPKVKSKKDQSNFNARKEDRPPQVTYKDPKNGWDRDFATSS